MSRPSAVGLLVGYMEGAVASCYTKDGIVIGGEYVGGLVGRNSGHVTRCYSTGAVSGTGGSVGGLVGANGVRHSRYVIFQMAEVDVLRVLFREILDRIRRLRFLIVSARRG